jgi:putative DNA primase/helicase
MQDDELAWVNQELQSKSVSELAAELSAELNGIPFKPPAYRLLTGFEIVHLPAQKWLIRNVLPETGLAAIFGAPGSGKTFLALDLAHAIASDREWFGIPVKHTNVCYVALEGEGGIAKRYKALMQKYPAQCDMRFTIQPFSLIDVTNISELADSIIRTNGSGGVVIIDTLNRASPGCDENSSSDMGRIIAGSKLLQDLIGGLILLIHHSGKESQKGMRGHSSLIAALDAAIEVTRTSDVRQWKLAKAKDGADGQEYSFRLDVIELEHDDQGEPITSCVVSEDKSVETVKRAKTPQGATQQIVYAALNELLRGSRDFGKAGAPTHRPCLELEEAIIQVSSRLTCRPDQRQFQARRAIAAMQSKGIFQVNAGWIWLI